MNKVVAHTNQGRMLKGTTNDFFPNKDRFHLVLDGDLPGDKPLEIMVGDLKAVFFVKDLQGNRDHHKKNEFDPNRPVVGRKIRIVFKDGEIMLGTTQGYQPGRPGFFVIPADPGSNNERCFVVTAATKEVHLL